jgi:hypothetical protein
MNEKMCPVCGFVMEDGLWDFNICPSCGTEFGVNDRNATLEELRQEWIETGPTWQSTVIPQPENWNPIMQFIDVFTNQHPNFSGRVIMQFDEGNLKGMQTFELHLPKNRKRVRIKRRLSRPWTALPEAANG